MKSLAISSTVIIPTYFGILAKMPRANKYNNGRIRSIFYCMLRLLILIVFLIATHNNFLHRAKQDFLSARQWIQKYCQEKLFGMEGGHFFLFLSYSFFLFGRTRILVSIFIKRRADIDAAEAYSLMHRSHYVHNMEKLEHGTEFVVRRLRTPSSCIINYSSKLMLLSNSEKE